jgi:hypothetical protein
VAVTIANLVWMLTALAAVVIMLTRSRLIASAKQAGVTETPQTLLNAHSILGILAVVAWVVWLVGHTRALGWVAIVLWWAVVVVGLMVLARWMPADGRHARAATDDGWAHGPWLSALGHVGMLLGVAFFTWVFIGSRL